MTQPGGVWVAALTPMNPDLSPDTAKFVDHCTDPAVPKLMEPGGIIFVNIFSLMYNL